LLLKVKREIFVANEPFSSQKRLHFLFFYFHNVNNGRFIFRTLLTFQPTFDSTFENSSGAPFTLLLPATLRRATKNKKRSSFRLARKRLDKKLSTERESRRFLRWKSLATPPLRRSS